MNTEKKLDYVIELLEGILKKEEVLERVESLFAKEMEVVKREEYDGQSWKFNDTEVYYDQSLIKHKGKVVALGNTGFEIVAALVRRPLITFSRQYLQEASGMPLHTYDRTIDSHIKKIRQAFKEIDKRFDCIQAVYGVGYRWKVYRNGDKIK